jgi:hypothetical protein
MRLGKPKSARKLSDAIIAKRYLELQRLRNSPPAITKTRKANPNPFRLLRLIAQLHKSQVVFQC